MQLLQPYQLVAVVLPCQLFLLLQLLAFLVALPHIQPLRLQSLQVGFLLLSD